MHRLAVIIAMGLCAMLFPAFTAAENAQPAADRTSSDSMIFVPVNLSVLPFAGIRSLFPGKNLSLLSVNVLAGYDDQVTGLNCGVVSLTGDRMIGVQASGLCNYTGKNVFGLQAAGLFNISDQIFGIQCAGLMNTAASTAWVQIGVINQAGHSWAQAGVLNLSASNSLLQAGVVNIQGGPYSGVQAGIFNYSEDPESISIGLVSINTGGKLRGQVYVDETGFITTGIKYGAKALYNSYSTGYNPLQSRFHLTVGLGHHFTIDPNLFCDAEVSCGAVFRNLYWDRDHPSMLWKAGASFGFLLSGNIFIVTGVSLNYESIDFYRAERINPLFYGTLPLGNDLNRFWPGFTIGLEF